MKKIKIISVAVIVIVIAVASLLAYLGMFSKVTVTEKEMGPYTYAYQKFVGSYYKTGAVFQTVNGLLKTAGVEGESGIGVYYDNPATVEASKLRSDCGAIIAAGDVEKIKKIKELSVATQPKAMFLVVELPVKNSLSYMVGPMKAYPAIGKIMLEKKYKPAAGIELYDMKNKKVMYMMQIIESK